MKKTMILLIIFAILTGCLSGSNTNDGSVNPASPVGPGQGASDSVASWQSSALGQEGHGGDAIVCFSIPVSQALRKVTMGEGAKCNEGQPCLQVPSDGSASSMAWQMTEVGRRSIVSAKPLEQYLAERIVSKKVIIDQLNKMSVEEGYEKLLAPFRKLPAAYKKISDTHRQLGWLIEDGIASEYGLQDINDSGFVDETEIDTTHCKELQAVVRRDSQLWYDKDIARHFDNAGLVLIQLHEEIYTWGKWVDSINRKGFSPLSHQTSTNTRRVILKVLDTKIDESNLNDHLKNLAFSVGHAQSEFLSPTSPGYFMTSQDCIAEIDVLKKFLSESPTKPLEFDLAVSDLVRNRYVGGHNLATTDIRYNFPHSISNLIYLAAGSTATHQDFTKIITELENPQTCTP